MFQSGWGRAHEAPPLPEEQLIPAGGKRVFCPSGPLGSYPFGGWPHTHVYAGSPNGGSMCYEGGRRGGRGRGGGETRKERGNVLGDGGSERGELSGYDQLPCKPA